MKLFDKDKMADDALYVLEHNDENTELLSRIQKIHNRKLYHNERYIYFLFKMKIIKEFQLHGISETRLKGRSVVQCLKDDANANIIDFSEVVELIFNKSGQLIYKSSRANRIKLKRHRHKENA